MIRSVFQPFSFIWFFVSICSSNLLVPSKGYFVVKPCNDGVYVVVAAKLEIAVGHTIGGIQLIRSDEPSIDRALVLVYDCRL